MNQVINFNDLKSAFEPKTQSAQLTHISGDALVSHSHKDDLDALNKEITRLSDLLKNKSDQYQSLEEDHLKALRHLKLLAHEKTEHDNEFQKLHEDKMRSVRLINSKNLEVQNVRRELTKAQQLERQVKIKLSHARGDIEKFSATVDVQGRTIDQLKAQNASLKQTIAELQVEKSLGNKVKEIVRGRVEAALYIVSQLAVKLHRLSQPKASRKETAIQWTSVNKSLPKASGTVFVRNGYQADIAQYNARTRKFKLMNNKGLAIQEWAPVNHTV